MGGFLKDWANLPPAKPPVAVGPNEQAGSTEPMSAEPMLATALPEREEGVPWPDWKAAELNRLFQERGATGQPGRITAATVRHGETGRERVDSPATNEQPMSRAEATE